MFICICNAITERQVQSAVAQGARSLTDLQGQLGVATCCGCCAETATEYLPGGRYAGQASTAQAAGALTGSAANDSGIPAFQGLVQKVALSA
ncbi:MAG: (2Fe-2S)-binding protein [Burkholderiaceae bacterium]|nr:(2Fe-2S)-binding protein [Burkholderiaceae bacterium]